MTTFWKWVKRRYYYVVVVPLTFLGGLVLWLLWPAKKFGRIGAVPQEEVTDAFHQLKLAEQKREEALIQLELEAQEKLRRASAEQLKEYEDVRKKSLFEVAAWIDRLG